MGFLVVLLNGMAYGTQPAGQVSGVPAVHAADTSATIPPPQLIFPSDEALDIPVKTFLRWQTVDEAEAYRVQLSLDEHFRDQIADSLYLTAAIVEPDSLLFDRVYYWRVQSVRDGAGGRWSQVRSFTTVVQPPPVTVPKEPEPDAVHVPVTPKLTWESAARAASYRLQLSRTPGFETIEYEAEPDFNEHIPERLDHLTRYYWRVRGENAGGAGSWSEVRSFETIIAIPSVPALSIPHNAARHVTVRPELIWNETDRAEIYRVQVSASEHFDSLLVDFPAVTGTALYLDSLRYNTSWYWRVRAVNIGGNSAWSRTYRFTTIMERPERPELATPVPDTLHQPVSPELVWHRAGRAATYRFQLSRTPDFRNLVYDETGISDTTYAVFFLDHLTPYYWRVRASNTGGYSDWSEPRKFTTIINVPGKPAILTPRQDDIHIPVRLTANWTKPERASSYRIQVSRTGDFRFPVVGRNAITDTITSVNGLDHNETFYLRVRAVNIGGEGEWSDPVSFRTMVKEPTQPVVVAPEHLARHVPVNAVLRWQRTDRAAAYNLQVSVHPDFRFLIANVQDITEPAYTISGLSHATLYYWRVRALNTGGLSAWSDIRQFTTIVAAPDVAEAVQPQKFADDQPVRTRLVWKSGARAAHYTVQLSVNAEFSDILHEKKEIRDTTYTTPSLQHERSYFWRVKSVNRGGESGWSEISHYTTIIQAPPVPELVSPDHYMFDVPTSPVLAWNSVTRARNYDVQISRDSDFSSMEIDTSGVEILYLDYSGLEGNRDYYWRVRAANEGGKSGWSEVWMFTTARPSFRSNLPTELTLQQNHPNPFNPATQIRYGLPEMAEVRLEVYNMLGQLVSVLVSGQQPAGYHTATFDASGLSNGIYVYRLFAGNEVITRKMTLVK
ncbi:MAG: fibronectin type III domain-containing protein [Cyclonatronaceae bacterium]